ncbi:hypothetical protein ACFQ10_05565 [Streptomyces indonesiensis]
MSTTSGLSVSAGKRNGSTPAAATCTQRGAFAGSSGQALSHRGGQRPPREQGVRAGEEQRQLLLGGVHRLGEGLDPRPVGRQMVPVQDDQPVSHVQLPRRRPRRWHRS